MIDIKTLSQQEVARFDFLQALRLYNYEVNVASIVENYSVDPDSEVTREQVGDLISSDLLYQFSCGIQRQAQIIGWDEAIRAIEQRSEVFQSAFEETETFSDGLMLDESIELPDYYTINDSNGCDDIHLTPGGYWGNPLVGPIYELGGALYRTNWRQGYSDSPPGSLVAFAESAKDSSYERILDLGCSFGSLTMACRMAYPEAKNVIGIDISESALRWAHNVAKKRGTEVVFEQRNVLSTGYEDKSFDLITGFLLLHEIPYELLPSLLKEVFRLLDEGGQVRFLDLPPYEVLSSERAFLQSFDAYGNGEVHWDDFLSRDLKSLLTEIGFEDVEDGPLVFEEPEFKGSAALMRTSEFRPENRWVTSARKMTSND
mgnify:CR=1 FL=1|jgi:SAM-dependent methyltransferase|tara:strand:- start:860 stop:1978 length:1119 start_codon:yes stop_codon:yes gene_type:complete